MAVLRGMCCGIFNIPESKIDKCITGKGRINNVLEMEKSRAYIESLMVDAWSGTLTSAQKAEVDAYCTAHPEFAEEQQSLAEIWENVHFEETYSPTPQLSVRFDAILDAYESGLHQSLETVSVNRLTTRNTFSLRTWWQALWQSKSNLGFGLQLSMGMAMLLMGVFVGRGVWQNGAASMKNSTQEVSQLRHEVDQLNRQMALTMLQQNSASDRLQGIDKVSLLTQPTDDTKRALMDALNYDPSLNVRLAAVEVLTPIVMNDPSMREQIKQSFVRQDSPMVQAMIADMFVQTKEKSSAQLIEQVIEKTPDPNFKEHFVQTVKALEND